MSVLVTGAAGFIGAALAERLLRDGQTVYGLDNFSDYYDPKLKHARVTRLQDMFGDKFVFRTIDLADFTRLLEFVAEAQPTIIYHLAAQASVRYALKNPAAYCHSNLVGHFNVLEVCRQYRAMQPQIGERGLKHLVYASTSSIYGGNEKVPFSESDDVSRPISLYAASKRSDELLTYSYSHMFGLPATAVRFFTVYGPWGRPDMSPWIFAKAILEGKPVPMFNKGDLWRDFTYVDDIVEGVVRLGAHVPAAQNNKSAPHEIYNLGNSQPVQMLEFVEVLGDILGKKPVLDLQPCPPTEVYKTFADTSKLEAAVGWKPYTPLRTGLEKFATWFVDYRQKQ
ncbi:MAG: NAD-dependent epimerase/dehydratase family protein [Alphaproteobacteria bacterium]